MRTRTIKKEIYLGFIVLGAVMLFIALGLENRRSIGDPISNLIYFITMTQGSICFAFGAFTWIFHEDSEVWRE